MSRPAYLESWAARGGVAVLVGISATVGFTYWQVRHEEQLAWVTRSAELIACCGLAVARQSFPRHWGWGIVGIFLTIMAAGWCGVTMFEKIKDDGRARAVASAQQTLPYRTAQADLEAASSALRAALSAPRPIDQGPLTIAAWDAAQAATVHRLESARDDALARVTAAVPPITFDWLAAVRGFGMEIIKLLGFATFGLRYGQRPPARPQASPHPPLRVVDGGRQLQHKAGLAGISAGLLGWAVGSHGEVASPSIEPFPVDPMVDREHARPIAPIAAHELPALAKQLAATMGERKIASVLSARYGEQISRWRVRTWLGRLDAAA